MPPVGISQVGTESGNLHLRAILHHENDAKARAHVDTRRKQFLHSVGMRIRCHIVVLWFAPEYQVTDAPAHKVGFEARGMQFSADVCCKIARSHAAIMRPKPSPRKSR